MAIVTLRLSAVKEKSAERPRACRYCEASTLQGWGSTCKPVRDTQMRQLVIQRYHCTVCRRTFRYYPSGVDGGDQTVRLRQLAALAWALGLSTRSVTGLFTAFGVSLCHMTVWRDVQALARHLLARRQDRRVPILGVDGVGARWGGQSQGIVVAVDLGRGEPVALGVVDERDPRAVVAWLRPLAESLGVEVVVTDDLASYGVALKRLGLGHQVCHFHLRRWVGRALGDFRRQLGEEGAEPLAAVKRLVWEVPAGGDWELFRMWEGLAPPGRQEEGMETRGRLASRTGGKLRQMAIRLSQNWAAYRLYQERSGVPTTNNGTEQAIGRWRVRSRSVRGYKSWAGVVAGFMLSSNPLG